MSNLDPVVQIGDWYYQVVHGRLWSANTSAQGGQIHRLEPRLHSLLNFFLRHPNTLLAKDTLIEKVWPANEGTDAAVMRAVGALRKILGDDARQQGYIATVSKKGYCWLADIKPAVMITPENQATVIAEPARPDTDVSHYPEKPSGVPWRFISATAVIVLVCCASLAFVLAKYTAAPLVRLPDTITPISALSGQEYWPLLNSTYNYVVYQHQAPEQQLLNWSIQSLPDLKVEHLPQQYLALSQPVWLDEQQLLFRAGTTEQGCAFYRQQLLPVAGQEKPQLLWPCYQMQTHGLVRWQQQWLWADTAAGSADIVLFSAETGAAAAVEINHIAHTWRQLDAMLVSDDTLYLLVQQSFSSSALYRLALPGGRPELITAFPYLVPQFSWWSPAQLLLSPAGRELEILDLNSMEIQRLGTLTTTLAQAVRAPGQVLATQYLDYTTDIYSVSSTGQTVPLQFAPWHISNRSERLPALSEQGVAFVSERTGHAQVWLAQGKDSTQLTRLNEQQQIQQLLWHNGQLLLLINNQLYRLNSLTGEINAYPLNIALPGRFASCDNTLYWTALTDTGWQLFAEHNGTMQKLNRNVVDVRCAPEFGIVLQFAGQDELALLQAGKVAALPVRLNWRQLGAEQWFTDSSGLYWLDKHQHALQHYAWQSAAVTKMAWPQPVLPLAIYSNGEGLGYVVRQRPYDTDIVWLQNRR